MSGRIGIIGKTGQVASALTRLGNARGSDIIAIGRPQLDLATGTGIIAFLDHQKPTVVINAAAFTAVDKAETSRDEAFAINAIGAGTLAQACAARDIPLVHISTDYVFDGSQRTPYLETDLRKPLGIYGASKATGEVAVAAAAQRHIILRTAWVYGVEGGNFVKTMLRLARDRDELGVVGDQYGSPTFADDIATVLLDLAARLENEPADSPLWGVYHMTGGGTTTWHGFAEEIFRHASAAHLKTPRLNKITTQDYPTPARRPEYSVLDCSKLKRAFGIEPQAWEKALARAIAPIINQHTTPHS